MASNRLGVKWEIQPDRVIALKYKKTTIIDRRKVFKLLRSALRNDKFNNILKMKHQGKTAACFGISKSSTHYHHTGDFILFADWRFIHRARLGIVPLNGYRDGASAEEKRCRRCGFPMESLPHVINHCKRYLPIITKRHNIILVRLKLLPAEGGTWLERTKP